MNRDSRILRVFISAAALSALLLTLSCGPPAWLSGAGEVDELLTDSERFDHLTLAGTQDFLLVAGVRQGGSGGVAEIFALRVDLDGGILDRWILNDSSGEGEIQAMQLSADADGFVLAALARMNGSNSRVLAWRFSSGGKFEKELPEVALTADKEGEFAASGARMLVAGQTPVLVYFKTDLVFCASSKLQILVIKILPGALYEEFFKALFCQFYLELFRLKFQHGETGPGVSG